MWKYYGVDESGEFVLFDVEACEACGGEICKANSVKAVETERKLQAMRLEKKEIPGEGFWSETLGGVVCSACVVEE